MASTVGHGFEVLGNFAKDVGHMAIDWAGVNRMMGYAKNTQGGARNWRNFSKEVWGADEEGLTTFTVKRKADDGSEIIDRYSGARIAGTIAGLGVGYRALSGGGLYRDKNGNTDIAGIPFV